MPTQYMFVDIAGTTSVTIPSSWNVFNNRIDAIGPGGNALVGSGIVQSFSGGGGAWCFVTNVPSSSIQPGDVLQCTVPANSSGGQETQLFDRTVTLILAADFGGGGGISGIGGNVSNNTPVGVGFNGGNGTASGDVLFQGPGGGAAAGPNGAGANGAASGGTTLAGGGGAAAGGTAGNGPSGSNGGQGGTSFGGTLGGLGGTPSALALPGSLGSGGGGGSTFGTGSGGLGSTDPYWDATHGPGSGGGGAGAGSGRVGGNGGRFGGGGGGVNGGTAGLGGQGLLVFSWFVPAILVPSVGQSSSPAIRRSVRMSPGG